jgi:hypothetical protein
MGVGSYVPPRIAHPDATPRSRRRPCAAAAPASAAIAQVPLEVLNSMERVPAPFLKSLAEDRGVFSTLPQKVKQQVWEHDKGLLQSVAIETIATYKYESATLLSCLDMRQFVGQRPLWEDDDREEGSAPARGGGSGAGAGGGSGGGAPLPPRPGARGGGARGVGGGGGGGVFQLSSLLSKMGGDGKPQGQQQPRQPPGTGSHLGARATPPRRGPVGGSPGEAPSPGALLGMHPNAPSPSAAASPLIRLLASCVNLPGAISPRPPLQPTRPHQAAAAAPPAARAAAPPPTAGTAAACARAATRSSVCGRWSVRAARSTPTFWSCARCALSRGKPGSGGAHEHLCAICFS